MEDEIFGPLLPLLTYSDLGELLAKIKSLPKPLAGYVFSREPAGDRPSVAIAFVRRGCCESDQHFLVYRIYALPGSGNVRYRELRLEIRLWFSHGTPSRS